MKITDTHDASSLIDQTIFDDEEQSLIVLFKNSGQSYKYMNFDQSDYQAFEAASSKGSYFCSNIKPNHPVVKL